MILSASNQTYVKLKGIGLSPKALRLERSGESLDFFLLFESSPGCCGQVITSV